jgi:hypothetical protein
VSEPKRRRPWWRKKRWWAAGLLLWLVIAGPVAAGVAIVILERVFYGDWSDATVAESQAAGDEIIAALRRYREERGTLPPGLPALVPSFLNEIRPPVSGNGKWIYKPRPDGSFKLAFQGSDISPVCFYQEWQDGAASEWYIDTR